MTTRSAFAVQEIVPDAGLVRSHKAAGGESIRQFIAQVHDGYLRMMLAVEPLSPKVTALHLSISFCATLSGDNGPRLATDEECTEVRHQLRKYATWFGEFHEETAKKAKIRNFWNERFR